MFVTLQLKVGHVHTIFFPENYLADFDLGGCFCFKIAWSHDGHKWFKGWWEALPLQKITKPTIYPILASLKS